MVFVAIAKAAKRPRVVPEDHRVHTLGYSDLPGVVLAQAMHGAALTQGDTLGVLVADGLSR